MTPLVTAVAARAAFTLAVALCTLAATPHKANAFSFGVKIACAADYFANCRSHSPDSPETRSCMRAVGPGLSHGCVDALVAAGEVSAAEVAKRRASSNTASANSASAN